MCRKLPPVDGVPASTCDPVSDSDCVWLVSVICADQHSLMVLCPKNVCLLSKICVIPRNPAPPPDPPSAAPPLRRTQNFALFSFSHLHFQSFLLSLGIFSCLFFSLRVSSRVFFTHSGVFSWNFGGVLVGRDLKCACSRPQVVLSTVK